MSDRLLQLARYRDKAKSEAVGNYWADNYWQDVGYLLKEYARFKEQLALADNIFPAAKDFFREHGGYNSRVADEKRLKEAINSYQNARANP